MIGRVLRHSTRILRPSLAVTVNKRNGSFFKKYVEPWYPPLQPTPDTKWASANDFPVSYKGIMPILPVGWLAMYFPEQIIYSYRFGDYRLATEQIEYGPVYPDPKEWTDEELGIPPDDAD